ncbi:MAG: helix-turn-helix domain-containing protein [bacterium]
MKKMFEIVPVEGSKNLVELTMKKGFKLQVDKKERIFVKFVMMVLHYGGESATYFAPFLGFTDRAFHNIKENFKERGIQSLFHGNHGKQNARKITDEHRGKILTLIVQNPTESNRVIADKFNEQGDLKIGFRSVERLRNQYKLLKKKKKK